jgi:hypothetical protein
MHDSVLLGTGTLSGGIATFSSFTIPVVGKTVVAVYGGDENFAKSQSKDLDQAVEAASTTTTLSSSQNPSNLGQPVTFTATVTPEYGGTVPGAVTFMDGTKRLAVVNLSGGISTYTTSQLAVGSHNITAKYYSFQGYDDFTGSSASLTQTVN